MKKYSYFLLLISLCIAFFILPSSCFAISAVNLPPDVQAVWDINKAYRETTPTRERICINGLWRWQPIKRTVAKVPTGNWGYLKVPGAWPGTRHWMYRESQTLYPHSSWKSEDMSKIGMAWYQREIEVPKEWAGRRVSLYMEYLNSYAAVFVDGNKMGEINFPSGEVEITSACYPGNKYLLSLFIIASPLNKKTANWATHRKADVKRRGLCGDMFLVSTPAKSRIDGVKMGTSVRKWEITFDTALQGLEAGKTYSIYVRITDKDHTVRHFKSKFFKDANLKNGHFVFTSGWKPSKLWDIHTPQHLYEAKLSLFDSDGNLL